MGSEGSGRHRFHDPTSSYLQIDVRRWQREGFLTAGRWFEWHWSLDNRVIASIHVQAETSQLTLAYQYRDGERALESFKYAVSITWTACHYGGMRPWFICPAIGCARRVAILYLSRTFACRKCCRLTFNSQRRTASDRASIKAQKIRMRLGGSGNLFEPFPGKPTGMHWSTYERLLREEEAANARSWPAWLSRGVAIPSGSQRQLNAKMFERLMALSCGDEIEA